MTLDFFLSFLYYFYCAIHFPLLPWLSPLPLSVLFHDPHTPNLLKEILSFPPSFVDPFMFLLMSPLLSGSL